MAKGGGRINLITKLSSSWNQYAHISSVAQTDNTSWKGVGGERLVTLDLRTLLPLVTVLEDP